MNWSVLCRAVSEFHVLVNQIWDFEVRDVR